jgi:hypothetical protein
MSHSTDVVVFNFRCAKCRCVRKCAETKQHFVVCSICEPEEFLQLTGGKPTPQIIAPENIVNPQVQEVCRALLDAGHIEDAIELAASQVKEPTSIDDKDEHRFEYLVNKRLWIRNLWIHLIGKKLEYFTCGKAKDPCQACISEARKIAPIVWRVVELYMAASKSTLTEFQRLDLLEGFIKQCATLTEHRTVDVSSPVQIYIGAHNVVKSDELPTIKKAPILEED